MSLTASMSGLEGQLEELADRLIRQEETTRRLEATLMALARLPDGPAVWDATGEDLIRTPLPTSVRTPVDIRWPVKRPDGKLRPAPEPVPADTETADADVLWAAAGFLADPLVGLDAAGKVRVWNPAAELAFGWPAPDVIGFPPPFLPDDRRAEQANLLAAACRGDAVRDVATVRKRKDGTLIRVKVSAAGNAGGAAFVVKVENPADPVAHVRPAFHPVRSDAATSSNDTVTGLRRVLSAVVHDLNNLLTVVCGGSESLIERHTLGDPRRCDAEMVHSAGVHASRLVQQLAGLATGATNPVPQADVNAVVTEMVPVLRGVLGSTRDLIVDAAAPEAVVAIDPSRLGQVLLNLTTNARDAMPGGGEVAVSTGLDESARVVLTVRDTGSGIDPAVRARMFERFVSTKSESRGLGLATVAEVVAQAGGTVSVESAPGQGTAVILTLPLAGD